MRVHSISRNAQNSSDGIDRSSSEPATLQFDRGGLAVYALSRHVRGDRTRASGRISFGSSVSRYDVPTRPGLSCAINGQVEGQVTRIKLIKRMMYGKAGFALLRQ